jgi:beta-glucuronidase
MKIIFVFFLIVCVNFSVEAVGILYPRASESREQINLDGLWKFVVANKSDQNKGFIEKWYLKDLKHLKEENLDMPVPSSYNDVTQDPLIRGRNT